MPLLTQQDCRLRWDEAVRRRGWSKRKVRLIMFDYLPAKHGPTRYRPAPAWPTIADTNNMAEEDDYTRMAASLLSQGEPYSERGAAAHGGEASLLLMANPVPVSRLDVVGAIQRVMITVHPLAVTQEQILRAKFFASLPDPLGNTIGTAAAAVHPERPTPSDDYVFSGSRGKGMRARYDLGFGHPTDSALIAGAGELKAGIASFDRLKSMSRFDENERVDPAPLACSGAKPKREEPLRLDVLKLLDPQLPAEAFRISWIALGKRGCSTDQEIRDRAAGIVKAVGNRRGLGGMQVDVDPHTGWLTCTWPQENVRLELAWYRPAACDPEKFEAIFEPSAASLSDYASRSD